ncbi:hypothetical protein RsTz2092_00400 [Deferribacterales bacterium RsTz2092]
MFQTLLGGNRAGLRLMELLLILLCLVAQKEYISYSVGKQMMRAVL